MRRIAALLLIALTASPMLAQKVTLTRDSHAYLTGADNEHATLRAAFKESSQISSVSSDLSTDLPCKIQLYPNPVTNGMLNVSYNVPQKGNVRIELFSATGEKIATLVKARQPAGTHYLEASLDEYALLPGTYMIRSVIDDQSLAHTVVKSR